MKFRPEELIRPPTAKNVDTPGEAGRSRRLAVCLWQASMLQNTMLFYNINPFTADGSREPIRH